MNISEELRERLIANFRTHEKRILQAARKTPTKKSFINMPFPSDNCIDLARYNVAEDRIDRLSCEVAIAPTVAFISSHSALTYASETVVIELPKEGRSEI